MDEGEMMSDAELNAKIADTQNRLETARRFGASNAAKYERELAELKAEQEKRAA
jgi:hypothetical protein